MSNLNTGIGFETALFLLFLGLKLTGYITWSWWWIFSPLWIPIMVLLLVLGLCGIVLMMFAIVSYFFL